MRPASSSMGAPLPPANRAQPRAERSGATRTLLLHPASARASEPEPLSCEPHDLSESVSAL